MSACKASRLRAVSLSVSPFVRLDAVAEMLITSALNRKAASSNDVRVRVLGSTKKFTSVFPRNAGTFLISRVPTCLKASAVSRTRLISSTDNSRSPSKSLRFQRVVVISKSGAPELRVAHASRVLAKASRFRGLSSEWDRLEKTVSARRRNQHAGRVRYPNSRGGTDLEIRARSFFHQPNPFVGFLFAQPQPYFFVRRGR